MTATTPCPDPSQLGELLAGRLSEDAQAALAEHVESCESCRNALDAMADGGELDGLAGRGEATVGPAFDEAIAELRAEGASAETMGAPATDGELSLDFLTSSDDPDLLGRFGPYDIHEAIGRGGMGVVLKGYDPRLHRFVAVKVLSPQLASNPTARKRFLREAQAAAAVSHDHVVTIHAVDEANSLPYLVMEYVDGVSLQERIDRTGPLRVKEILRIGMQTAAGLAAAHAQGLIHRDIKPANILLENGVERVKITDFGLARAVDDVGMTQTGVVSGTPQYMAPEQARGDPVDQRADLFSLGSVLYAMCTGRSPFRADSTVAVIRRVCDDTPRPIDQVNPEIPDWLAAVIDRLLAKDPNQRFQSTAEVADLLGQYLAHLQQPTVTPRPAAPARPIAKTPPVQPGPRSTNSSTAMIVVVILMLVVGVPVLCLVGVAAWFFWAREGTQQATLVPPQVIVQEAPVPHPPSAPPAREVTMEMLRFDGGHTGQIHCVAFSPDGRHVLSGSEDHTVRRWDTSTGLEVGPVLEHERSVYSIAVSPDGRHVLSGSFDGSVRLWDVEGGEQIRRFEGHRAPVMAVAFSPDGPSVVSGSFDWVREADHSIRLWDVDSGRQLRSFEGETHGVCSLALSPDCRYVLAGLVGRDTGQTVRLWDVETGQEIRPMNGDFTEAHSVAFSPDGRHAVSGHVAMTTQDGMWLDPSNAVVRLWDVESGRQIRQFTGHTGSIWSVAFSPDGRYVVSGSGGKFGSKGSFTDTRDKTIRLWDADTGRELCRFHADATIHTVTFSPDGRSILSGGADGGRADLRLWELPEDLLSSSKKPATAAESDAFVILAGEGEENRKFDTLAEAVASANDGDTIEVRGNGPFVSHPVNIRETSLVIRAADGFRPVIKLSPEGVKAVRPLLNTSAPLVLEGLELQRVDQESYQRGQKYPPIVLTGQPAP